MVVRDPSGLGDFLASSGASRLQYLRLLGMVNPSAETVREISEGLSRNTSVDILEIGGDDITGEALHVLLSYLQTERCLRKLSYQQYYASLTIETEALVSVLMQKTSLVELQLEYHHERVIGRMSWAELLPKNQSLTFLSLKITPSPFAHQDLISDVARGLCNNKALRCFDLILDVQVYDEEDRVDVKPIAEALIDGGPPLLETLRLDFVYYRITNAASIAELVGHEKCTLKSFVFHAAHIEDQGFIKSLFRSVQQNPRLKKLDLKHDGEGTYESLVPILPQLTHLTHLSFEAQSVEDNQLEDVAAKLLESMKANKSLEFFHCGTLNYRQDLDLRQSMKRELESHCIRNRVAQAAAAIAKGTLPAAVLPTAMNALQLYEIQGNFGKEPNSQLQSHNATILYSCLRWPKLAGKAIEEFRRNNHIKQPELSSSNGSLPPQKKHKRSNEHMADQDS